MHRSIHQIYLVRHGETEWSVTGQHTGRTDIPLTQHGRMAAKRMEPCLAKTDFALVLSSPLERARSTCELAGFGEKVEVDQDLMEWNYGAYEGLTSKQIHAQSPDWTLFRDGCPGGESPDQVRERVDRVIAKARTVDGNVILFAHGHILRALAVRWLGFPVEAGCHFVLDTATISMLSHYHDIPIMKQWNTPLES